MGPESGADCGFCEHDERNIAAIRSNANKVLTDLSFVFCMYITPSLSIYLSLLYHNAALQSSKVYKFLKPAAWAYLQGQGLCDRIILCDLMEFPYSGQK